MERGENDYITQKRGKKRHKELQTRKPTIAHIIINFSLEIYRTEWRKCWTKINPANRHDLEKNTPQ